MKKFRFLLISLLVLVSTQLCARIDLDLFSKSLDINFGASVLWKYNDDTAVKSALDNKDAGTYYHLMFDGKSLRLMLSESSTDNPASAKHYDQFAIEDVQIDGQRLPLFQWCLSHQERHARFLQQGLTVQKNICENNGARGTFAMRMNQATLEALQSGQNLTFVIRPFRTTITLNYALSDFPEMVAILASKNTPTPLPVQAGASPVTSPVVVPVAAPVNNKMCVLEPPAGFDTIQPINYHCNSQSEKARASNSMIAQVSKEREQRNKIEQEKERKRLAMIAANKKAEEERLKREQQKKEEEAAIAASKLKQQEINAEITAKMLGVCSKMWSKGEHRCYCEKYIDQAPESIRASSSCSGGS
jgi:hypothetical protein